MTNETLPTANRRWAWGGLAIAALALTWYVSGTQRGERLSPTPPPPSARRDLDEVDRPADRVDDLPNEDSRSFGAATAQHNTVDSATQPVGSPSSQSLDTRHEATYVGAATCGGCHEQQFAGYSATMHSRAFREVNVAEEPPDGEFGQEATGLVYFARREGNQLRHGERLRLPDGAERELASHPVRYVVGSGHHARTYLAEMDGFLFESPITWYNSRREWALSPGYEHGNSGFSRPVYLECLFCHTGLVRATDGGRARFDVVTMAIDCERCHGPGSRHVSRWESAGDEGGGGIADPTTVHPGRLTRLENESICAQCHLHGDAAAMMPGRRLEEFQPGMALRDLRVQFTLQAAGAPMTVVGHVEQMHRSRCYERSDTLTCTTCHEVHGRRTAEDRHKFYRDQCLACHSTDACGQDQSARRETSPPDDCISCHMPPSATEVPHVAATNHRIGIYRDSDRTSTADGVLELSPFDDISHLPELGQARLLGLAYLDLSIKAGQPKQSEAYRERARQILERVASSGLNEPDLKAALAQIYQRRDPQRSVSLAQAALRAPNASPSVKAQALYALSDSYLALRRTDAAIEPLEELVRLRRQAGDWFLLGVCRYSSGELSGALEAAKQAVAIRPEQPNFRALLAELYERTGNLDESAKQKEWGKMLTEAIKRE